MAVLFLGFNSHLSKREKKQSYRAAIVITAILSRIMGFLLICIGAQFAINGVRDLALDTG
jgi:small neutral amino acid transporter SnatA (MarC family)